MNNCKVELKLVLHMLKWDNYYNWETIWC